MELSSFSVLDSYPGGTRTGPDRYAEFLRLAEVSERCGLRGIWVAEHHFHAGGVCPSPPVLLAAASMRTRTLRIGSLVSVLPFHDPISIAEEYAVLDRISGGRLRLGVGSGYIPLEFEGFGADPVHKREQFDRALAILRSALAGEPVRLDRPGATPVRINVRPLQRPHPPIWVAVQRPEAVGPVAAQGFSVALLPYATVDDLAGLRRLIARFRSASPASSGARIGVAVHLYSGPDPARARRAFQRYLDTRMAARSPFFRGPVRVGPRRSEGATFERQGFALFGGRRELEAGLDTYRRAGVDELLGMFDFGGLRPDEVHRSVHESAAALARRSPDLEAGTRATSDLGAPAPAGRESAPGVVAA